MTLADSAFKGAAEGDVQTLATSCMESQARSGRIERDRCGQSCCIALAPRRWNFRESMASGVGGRGVGSRRLTGTIALADGWECAHGNGILHGCGEG